MTPDLEARLALWLDMTSELLRTADAHDLTPGDLAMLADIRKATAGLLALIPGAAERLALDRTLRPAQA